ncbi:MAG TPA: glycosyltransferase [Acidimicrobiales bacterium]
MSASSPEADAARTSVAVYVCTYRRNGALRNMLDALTVSAKRAEHLADVAAVVVDDNPDGSARDVVDECVGCFSLGIHYRHCGKQNISAARNVGLAAAMELAEWVAMTDDDCEPDADWLLALLETQQRTGADALTGPLVMRFPPDAPRWLREEPFGLGEDDCHEDGARVLVAQTHNSMISSAWLRAHSEIRFCEELGVLGGEDMVFYRTAARAGLRIHYARDAVVHEMVPPHRATLRHQLRTQFWLGNSEYVTNTWSGQASRLRMAARGGRRLVRAMRRPVVRVVRGQRPQLRWFAASVLRALGIIAGVVGVRVEHR